VKGLRMRPERSATDVACFLAGDLFRRAFYTRRALADRRSAARAHSRDEPARPVAVLDRINFDMPAARHP
ncbi:hypothetical protein, partial [Pseudomonas aeruginosa]|uniref:hypothetical protein n=1 Tax=Pseudomonas aeruginosa TaxID=287 RepID=UPI0019690D1C